MFVKRGLFRVSLSSIALTLLLLAPLGTVQAAAVTRYVSTAGADVGDCSSAVTPCLTINYAVTQSLAGDTILITEGVFISSGPEVVLVNKSLALSGGWDPAFTEQTGLTTIDGQTVRRGITATDRTVVSLDRFLVRNGFHTSMGGGISSRGTLTVNNSVITANWSQWMGGGINIYGTLFVNDSVISQNKAGQPGYSGGGGGAGIQVYSSRATLNRTWLVGNQIVGDFSGTAVDIMGQVVVNDSTISSNSGAAAFSVFGGASRFTLNNTTVTGNRGSDFSGIDNAGAIENAAGQVFLNNSTITGNSQALGIGGVTNLSGYPGALVTLNNSIVAGNAGKWGTDCQGLIASAGHNILGSNYGCTFTPAEGDQVGTPANPIDPLVLPLDDYGGSTLTHALRPDSPARGAGNPATPGSGGNACLPTDQRGFDRIEQGPCDIGAYQSQRPAVESIKAADPNPNGGSRVAFAVAFTDAVSGVDVSDFQLANQGVDGAAIVDVSGSGDSYVVSVSTGAGQGTMRLDLIDDDSITDASGKPLGGPGLKNGDFRYGEAYAIDKIPLVQSVTLLDPDPTSASSVAFAVTFSRPVTGVDELPPFADFALTATRLPGAVVVAVTGSGADYILTANTGPGDGSLRLDVLDDDSILDAWGNPLGGPGVGNGDFATGESYTVIRLPVALSPSGVIAQTRPTYTWSLVPSAMRYQYEVLQDGDAIMKKTVFDDECGPTSCSDKPPKALKPGVYTWDVKAMVNGVWNEWSPPVEFTVIEP